LKKESLDHIHFHSFSNKKLKKFFFFYFAIQTNFVKMSMRVCEILSSLDTDQRRALKKLLPVCPLPELEKGLYPSALIAVLPKPNQYSFAGLINKSLLHVVSSGVEATKDILCFLVKKYHPSLTPEEESKVRKSKTTDRFLQQIKKTHLKILEVAKGEQQYDKEVVHDSMVGNPDIRTESQVFEVKMTCQLKEDWMNFLFELYAYAALAPEVKDVYLVLPLQESLWHFDATTWKERDTYKTLLESFAKPKEESEMISMTKTMMFLDAFRIGSHISKLKSLVATVQSTPPSRPFQIFLGNPQSTNLSITDAELAATAQIVGVSKAQVFIHSPFIINMCTEPGMQDDYQLKCLIKNLKYGAAMGAKGVVVHVGKSTKQSLDSAMSHMVLNIAKAAEEASPECPLLLETPAGQGTEVLTDYKEFVEFVKMIGSPNLKICIDTCHVFACGHNPLTYIQKVIEDDKSLLHLIHFNDSKTPCGSRVDRHAFCGTGHIGFDAMHEIAKVCSHVNVPMVVE
jgi:deoxyribonuclease IV